MRDRLFSIGTSRHYCRRFLGGSGTLTKRNQGLNEQLLLLFLTVPPGPLWVMSGHSAMSGVRPLCPRKRTPIGNKLWMSEFMSVRD